MSVIGQKWVGMRGHEMVRVERGAEGSPAEVHYQTRVQTKTGDAVCIIHDVGIGEQMGDDDEVVVRDASGERYYRFNDRGLPYLVTACTAEGVQMERGSWQDVARHDQAVISSALKMYNEAVVNHDDFVELPLWDAVTRDA